MNEMQRYIDHGAPPENLEEEFKMKDGAHFEQWLLRWWGRDGRITGLLFREYVKLSKLYGWNEVYEMVEFGAKMNKKSYQYVKVSCEKRAKQRTEKATAAKRKLVHCPKCWTGYWADQRHECEDVLPVFSEARVRGSGGAEESQEDVHKTIMKIKEEWSK